MSSALPAALANHSAWDAFHQRLCAPPPVNLQPPSDQHPATIPPSAALDADITEQEVELALPKLSHGKAVGVAGWPAELLRYAAHEVTMEDGSRHKVWVLALLLPASSTAASPLVHYHLASPRHSPPQSTKRAARLMPPTTGP